MSLPENHLSIADLRESDKGRHVIFHHHHGEKEFGELSSWNGSYIFCRFTKGSTAAACEPDQLTWMHP